MAAVGHLPHVGVDEVDRQTALLGMIRSADEHGQGEVEPGQPEPLVRQLQGMAAVSAANVENLTARRRR